MPHVSRIFCLLALAACALFWGAAGCAEPAPAGLLGTWEEANGRPGALTFLEGGRMTLDLERPDEPVEAGSYRIQGEAIVIQIGPEPTRLTLRDGALVQEDGTVYRRRDG